MPVHVVWNTLKDPLKRTACEAAVREVLAARPAHEHWDVKLTESAAIAGWIAVVTAPDHKNLAWYFHGLHEDDSPGAVRERLAMLLRAAGW